MRTDDVPGSDCQSDPPKRELVATDSLVADAMADRQGARRRDRGSVGSLRAEPVSRPYAQVLVAASEQARRR